MKFLWLSLLLCSGTLLSAQTATKGKISLRADVWCPMNCEPKSEKPGFMVEIAKAAFAKINLEVDYQNVAWTRAIADARVGDYNGIIGAAKNDAPDFIFPTISIGDSQACLYTKPEHSWKYTDVGSLGKVKLGIINDYSYGDTLDNYILSVTESEKKAGKKSSKLDVVTGNNSLETNYKKLLAGRIDAMVEDKNVIGNFLYRNGYKLESVKNAGCLEHDDIFIAFSPKDPNAPRNAKLLSDTMATMRKDGTLKTILDRYGIQDWVQK